MKFLLTARFKDSWYALPPEKKDALWEATSQVNERQAKEGMVKDGYMTGNMKGIVAIYEFNSPEDMARAAFESPFYPFVDAEITPLTELDAVRKVMKAMAGK
jgi:hypothetical protein